ncbi:metallophosphatase family protein [Limnohabitans sp. 2KL-17]|uniref:metallophosphoesterase family protein n=1 Tax=Limnohabitans sp. 2KL-17 TaxID=1100704 RepID=UPI000D37DDBE|nr:metallophosphoesterase [Limnohabitans sp. 2KL-17]PUE51540.1 metallophosphatase family protein [Limnohabitans sp. 2KL-17]
MKLALISDIHANRQALQACLAHARQQGADRFVFLGDLVGYGADPVAVLDEIMDLASQGALVLRGNHDEMALNPPALKGADVTMGSHGAHWTHDQLTARHRAFLTELPLTLTHGHMLLVHASADRPDAWRYVDGEGAAGRCLDQALSQQQGPHVLVGHVHHQTLYYRGAGRHLMSFDPIPGLPVPTPVHRPMVACVGSCGQPRDGDPRAMYAICDHTAQKMTFHRVPYNHAEAAAAIRLAGLPEFFAQRLELGR